MQFAIHLLKKRSFAMLGLVADTALFLGIVLIGGLGTSWYMVEAGSRLTTRSIGPWVVWTSAARTDADPYTRAHFARAGTLPLSTDVAQTFMARADSEGQRLHSSCEYVVDGRDPPAAWWSLSVFDDRGRLIANPAQRYAFTSDTMAKGADGTFLVSLARDARPGNWLPTGGAGRLMLVLTLLDGRGSPSSQSASGDGDAKGLPLIRRVSCR
jgi:hypothetical protein